MESTPSWTAILTTDMPDNNTNVSDYIDDELPNQEMYAILVPTIWGVLTVIGTLGNALVIYTLVRYGDKNATNYFVINLAISDFAFVVIVLPFTATLYAIPHWIFGNGMCKITMYMIYVSKIFSLFYYSLNTVYCTIDQYTFPNHAQNVTQMSPDSL